MATHIYLGTWVNYTHGPILGATVTLSQRYGNLLVSFVATFVTIVGAQLWRIITFIIHQAQASKQNQDGLHYQQQTIFRNSSSPGGAAWSFFLQLWYWPGKAKRVALRTVPLMLFSVLYIALFGVLATFSAEVAKATGDLRLVRGSECGYWRLNDNMTGTEAASRAYNQKMANDTLVSSTYARACYGGTPSALQCETFPVGNIAWTAQQNASCPFASGMCVYGDSAAFRMTTGKIDSHANLGINMPAEHRIQLIMDTTCAPLIQKRETINGSGQYLGEGLDTDTLIRYYYGDIGQTSVGIGYNYSWQYNTHAYLDQLPASTYTVASAAPHSKGEGWNPIAELNETNTDVSLMFVALNSMRFNEPCGDPVFGANYEVRSTAGGFYMSDEWAVPISCAERFKICNPKNDQCTPWHGTLQLINASKLIGLDDTQFNIVDRLAMATQMTTMYHQTFTRGGSALRALEQAAGLSQSSLPNNQWQIEVSNWFDAGLSRLQHVVQDYATGPSNIVEGSYLWQPGKMDGNKVQAKMCLNQLVKDTGNTTSFSVVGLVIIFVIGLVIILTSITLDLVVGWIQERFKVGEYKKLRWQLDDKLQQQRMLLEGVGLGTWEGARGFPTTVQPQQFGGYDNIDFEHPAMHGSSPPNSSCASWIRPPSEMVPNNVGVKSSDVFVRQMQ